MSRLLIVSHTPHYRRGDAFVGWGATVREVDELAMLFEQVVHIAPLHPGIPGASDLPYLNERVLFRPVTPAGGKTLGAKLGIVARSFEYCRTIWRESRCADVIHVRCPASISLVAILLLPFCRAPRRRWIKYAGNWQGYSKEPGSYKLQRALLTSNSARAWVTVNGHWDDQPTHIVPFFNPCLTSSEMAMGRIAAARKQLTLPVQLLFVGRIEEEKGVGRAIQIVAELLKEGVTAELDIVGDGPDIESFHELARSVGAEGQVRFHGWCSRLELNSFYAAAHLLILPSCSEGWPKVLSEGMAYGVVPLAGAVGSIPQNLAAWSCGRAFAPNDVQAFVSAILAYCRDVAMWQKESATATEASQVFSYEDYLLAVKQLLELS